MVLLAQDKKAAAFSPANFKQGGCVGGGEQEQKAKIWPAMHLVRASCPSTHLACCQLIRFFLFSSFACFFNHSLHTPRPVEKKQSKADIRKVAVLQSKQAKLTRCKQKIFLFSCSLSSRRDLSRVHWQLSPFDLSTGPRQGTERPTALE
ncbi:hypothetical protein J3E69DRAFT_332626 [Trichoderma sp. SZMC 28015]